MNAEQKPRADAKLEEVVQAARPGAVPAAKRAAIYTMTAREGLDVAELVNAAFKAKKPIGARVSYRIEVVEPDGPSTSGGKRARQTIRLVCTESGPGPVMIGYLDVAQKVAELRTYDSVASQFEDRFGQPFDVSEAEYGALCKDLQATLGPFRYAFGYEAAKERVARPRAATRSPILGAALLGTLVVVAAITALTLLR